MRRITNIASIILLLYLSAGCEKPSIYLDDYSVSYTVNVYGDHVPDYTVSYRDLNGQTNMIGNLEDNSWNSPLLKGFQKGDYVELTVKSFTFQNTYLLRVYANGNLLLEEELVNPSSTLSLKGYLPQY
jgi:hypothetical protein